MGSFSNYLEAKLLDEVLGGVAYTSEATVYIGLWTASLADDSDGVTAGEGSGGSYARVAVTNNATNWPAAAGSPMLKSNGTAITFPQATADQGTVVDFAILNSASGAGDILGYGTLTVAKAITSGDTASFAIGELDVTLD